MFFKSVLLSFAAPAAFTLLTVMPAAAEAPLTAGEPILLPKTTGRFDFLAVDLPRRRLLIAHAGNNTFDVLDLEKKEVTKVVPTGAAQSSAASPSVPEYYVGVSKPPQLAVVDAEKLTVTKTVPLPGPADLIALNAKSGLVYIGHDDGKQLWVVNPKQGKIVSTIELPSDAPEDLAFDRTGGRLFQAMKTASVVLDIDTATNKITHSWPTAPAAAPHGVAVDEEAGALLVAGGNKTLVMMSQKDGHVLTSVAIPERVDQIAYDAAQHRLYCASGLGKIAVYSVAGDKITLLGEVACSAGTHSIVLDPKTHEVWIAFAKEAESFVQPFTAAK